jgi:hypothetical protein
MLKWVRRQNFKCPPEDDVAVIPVRHKCTRSVTEVESKLIGNKT